MKRRTRVIVPCVVVAMVLGGAATHFLIQKIARARLTRLGGIGNGLTRTHALVSPDGRRVAQLIHRGEAQLVGDIRKRDLLITFPGGKDFVVLDGKPGKEYDCITNVSMSFSPDSSRFAYRGEYGRPLLDEGSTALYVIDGVEGKKYDTVGKFVFSPDNKRTAYVAKKRKKDLVVLDGVELDLHEIIVEQSLAFGDDGALTYTRARDLKRCMIEERSPQSRE
jgi:hypothetical protein